MTTEEKAKAYDKALERAEALIAGETNTSDTLFYLNDIKSIFPELAESEDEKTRKELIQFIKNWKDPNNIGRPHDFPTLTRNVEQCDRYIAWLEKQAPKPKWSEEDDYNVHCCIAKAESDIANGCTGRNKELIDWLKSLKQRMEESK